MCAGQQGLRFCWWWGQDPSQTSSQSVYCAVLRVRANQPPAARPDSGCRQQQLSVECINIQSATAASLQVGHYEPESSRAQQASCSDAEARHGPKLPLLARRDNSRCVHAGCAEAVALARSNKQKWSVK